MEVVDLVNMALLKIGVSKGIAALDDATREAWTGEIVYNHTLRAALRLFPMGFSTKYADLYLVQGPVPDDDESLVQAWVAANTYVVGDVVTHGDVIYYALDTSENIAPPDTSYWTTTATERANNDWLYANRWPSDCLFARRITREAFGRTFDPKPPEFRVGRDVNGLLIYTNEPDANLEYTVIDCDALWADDLWLEAFLWWLAAQLAPSLSKDDRMHTKCLQMFNFAFNVAATVGSREKQDEPAGDAEWIRSR